MRRTRRTRDKPPLTGSRLPTNGCSATRPASRAEVEDALARRHDAPGDVAAGVHAAAGRAGPAAAPAPDPLPGMGVFVESLKFELLLTAVVAAFGPNLAFMRRR